MVFLVSRLRRGHGVELDGAVVNGNVDAILSRARDRVADLLCGGHGIWFTWGGVRDLGALFRHLRAEKVNDRDDGTVIDHQNLDELAAKKSKSAGATEPGRTVE